MENNINEILNPSENTDTQISDETNYSINIDDEKNLRVIANIILVGGIISFLILSFTVVFVKVPGEYASSGKMSFNASGLVITFTSLFSSIGAWALLRVIRNISLSLREWNKKHQ